MSKFDVSQLLHYIDPSTCSYQEWVNVGMALSKEGYPAEVWDSWSQQDAARYHDGECFKKWQSFRGNPNPITGATITEMAKTRGWKPGHSPDRMTNLKKEGGQALNWDSVISDDEEVIIDKHYLEGVDIEEPGEGWSPSRDMIRYLKAVFHKNDIVGYVNDAWEKEGRWVPQNKGHFVRTAGELIQSLEKYGDDIGATLGDYNPKAGAWIRINPLDGKGVKNENVADFRYTLIESDQIEPEKQNEIIRRLELPVAALVYSGNKSIHAIVHVDAANYEEYRQRVDFLYKICVKNGFVIDSNNRNPSRLSRLPGVMRNGKKQFLIDTNIGQPNYEEWREWFEKVNDDMPNDETIKDTWDDPPDLAPPLIDGMLRQGHKMIISGPSKAGKSFALIELCIAIAEGKTWMGFPCTQGRVYYVNLELDRPSCIRRFHEVYKALEIPPKHTDDIIVWNVRGKSLPMDKLAPKLIWRVAKRTGVIAVIIDPIYKVITGDENSADQMAHFCNQFDKVCTELGCAVIYCHHHSKGLQGMKKSIDRASGSGVFARDPDAILDMIQLRVDPEENDEIEPEATAWRIDGTLREFPKFKPVNVLFRYPIHEVDTKGFLATAAEEGDITTIREDGRKKGVEARQQRSKDRKAELPYVFGLVKDGDSASLEDIANYFGISERTVRTYIEETDCLEIKKGKVCEKRKITPEQTPNNFEKMLR